MSAPFGGGPLRIITADERLREARGIKGVLTGTSGIGKTTQLLTLDPQRTLFLNLEAGELAVQGWPGDEIRIRDWEVARDLAAWIGGANPAMRDDQSYGPGHFARVCAAFGPASQLGFQIQYMWAGSRRRYVPDFLVRLSGGKMLALEIKGTDSPQNKAKRDALNEWVKAINASGGFGCWSWDVAFKPGDVQDIITKHTAVAEPVE